MKKAAFLILLFPSLLFSQTPNFDWGFKISNANAWVTEGNSVAADSDNNSYVSGVITHLTDMDPSGATSYLYNTSGNRNIFLAKYSENKALRWSFTIDAQWSDDYSRDLEIYNDSILYLSGYFVSNSDSIDFNPLGISNKLYHSTIYQGGFIAKYDTSGILKWVLDIGHKISSYPSINNVEIDSQGNIVVLGTFSDSINVNPLNVAPFYLTTSNQNNLFIAKYDNNGMMIWAKKAEHYSGSSKSNGLSIDQLGDIYLTGWFTDSLNLNPNGTNLTLINSNSNANSYVSKYSNSGNFLWAKSLNATTIAQSYNVVHGNNNIYVSGVFSGTIDLNPNSGSANFSSGANTNLFLTKWDLNGNYIWGFKIDKYLNTHESNLIFDSQENNIIVNVPFWGTIDIDPDTSTTNISQTGGANNDLFYASYTECMKFNWGFKLGGNDQNVGNDFTLSPSGSLFITGRYKGGGMDMDPSSSNFNVTSTNSAILMGKYDIIPNTSLSGNTLSGYNNYHSYQWLDCNNSFQAISGETNQIFSITSSGSYALETDFYGCKDTTSCINIDCLGSFSWSLDTTNYDIIAVNSSVGNNLTYFWDFGDGDTSSLAFPSHVYDTTITTYYLCVTVSDGGTCVNTFCDSVSFDPSFMKSTSFNLNVIPPNITSENDIISLNNDINFYPNPNSGSFSIEATNFENTTINVYSISGQLILQKKLQNNTTKIDLTNHQRGMYFVKVKTENRIFVKKIVCQ